MEQLLGEFKLTNLCTDHNCSQGLHFHTDTSMLASKPQRDHQWFATVITFLIEVITSTRKSPTSGNNYVSLCRCRPSPTASFTMSISVATFWLFVFTCTLPQSLSAKTRSQCQELHWGSIVSAQLEPFFKGISRGLVEEAVQYIHTLPDQQGW